MGLFPNSSLRDPIGIKLNAWTMLQNFQAIDNLQTSPWFVRSIVSVAGEDQTTALSVQLGVSITFAGALETKRKVGSRWIEVRRASHKSALGVALSSFGISVDIVAA